MNRAETVFLNVLRSGLWGSEFTVPCPEDFQWKDVFHIAKSQSLAGVTGQYALDNPEISARLPEGLRKKIKLFIIRNAAIHSYFDSCLVHVVSELRAAGIEPVLLKGQGLARNWPRPELRQCGDIDLWVGEENYDKARKILLSLSPLGKEHHETIKHAAFEFGIVTIELHRFSEINTSSRRIDAIYRKYSLEGLSKNTVPIDFGGTEVTTPSDDFNAFYIFSHLWHHFISSGVGLRQICDWMLFLHSRKGKINLEYIEKLLDEMGLTVPWQVFGCIAVDSLGLPAEEFPFYCPSYGKRAEKVLRRILHEGNFGHERTFFSRKRSNVYIFRKTGSFILHILRNIGMLSVFPAETIKEGCNMTREGFRRVWKDFSKNI